MKRQRKATGKANIHPLVGCYLVIETEHNTPQEKVCGEVKGSFRTQDEAERWMIADAVDAFRGSDRSLQDGKAEEWGSDMVICEIKRVCRPVPVVKITARIMDTPNAGAVPRRNDKD